MNRYLFSVFIITAMLGCKGYQHVANPHFVPVFNKEKKELVSTIGTSYYQLGYSVSKNIFLFNTGFNRSTQNRNPLRGLNEENSGAITRTEKSFELDGGVGYIIRKDKKQFTLLVGGGGGRVKSSFEEDLLHNYSAQLNAHKYNAFIQPNITFLFGQAASVSTSTKFSYINYSSISSELHQGDLKEPYKEDLTFMSTKSVPFYFAEPSITSTIGGKHVKFIAQVLAPIKLNQSELRYKQVGIHFGLRLNL